VEPTLLEKETKRVARLERDASQLRTWLAANPEDRRGPPKAKRGKTTPGNVRLSNRTDPESAKMATNKGVLQGYTGTAAVDTKHQVIVDAQVFGTGSEQEALLPIVDALIASGALAVESLITADAGYHSEENLTGLATRQVNALIADGELRKRDERFATQDAHREKPDPASSLPCVARPASPLCWADGVPPQPLGRTN
jgi:hypothetical protein